MSVLRFISRLVSVSISLAVVIVALFFAVLFSTNEEVAGDIARSCFSCKKPSAKIIGPLREADGDRGGGWKIVLVPPSTVPKITPELNPTEQQSVALRRVNYYRSLVGIKGITLNEKINKSAEAHARYNTLHKQSGHQQIKGRSEFTGEWPWDRMKHFGYEPFTYATEVASSRWATHEHLLHIDPEWAVDGWIDTVYHRIPLINPNVYEAGFGADKADKRISYVMNFGNPGFKEIKKIIQYPVDGQENVPIKFTGDETPDPLPGTKYPVGYPITVTFNGYKSIKVQAVSLIDSNGVDVEFYRLDPYSDEYIKQSLAVIPKDPLEKRMTYRISVSASVDGESVFLEWSFKTGTASSSY